MFMCSSFLILCRRRKSLCEYCVVFCFVIIFQKSGFIHELAATLEIGVNGLSKFEQHE